MDKSQSSSLEPVSDQEIGQVANLITRAFCSTGWHTEEQLVSNFTCTEDQLRSQSESGTLLQWKEGSERIACVLVRPIDQEQHIWRFAWLAIEPTLQTSGLGRKMLKLIEDYAQQRGAATMDMNAMNVRKNLIAWYQRRGYALTGEKEPFIFKEESHGVAHRNDLCFLVLQKKLFGD